MSRISLCMIAKNEERFIGQAIQSVLPIVHEIILVDTGSTDATVRIATDLGARVLHRPWDGDFSLPRNLGLEHATGDWILVLDADEAVAARELKVITAATADASVCWELTQRHYSNDVRLSDFIPRSGEYPEWERSYVGYFESSLVRLFPNRRGIRYEGRIHELVEHSIRRDRTLSVKRLGVRLQHYGHTPEVLAHKNKTKLYTALGESKLGDDPSDWKAYFELAVEHNSNGRRAESVDAFKKAIELNPEYLDTWVNLGYVYCELGRFTEAEQTLHRAMKLEPTSAEAACNLGVVYLRTNRLGEAERCFRKAIHEKPDYLNAWSNLGKTLAGLGRLPEAANVYHRILELAPGYTPACAELGGLYLSVGLVSEAEKYLAPIEAFEPPHLVALFHLGFLRKAQKRASEATQIFTLFCDLARAPTSGIQPNIVRMVAAELDSLASGADALHPM